MDGQIKRDRQKERENVEKEGKQTNDYMNGWTDEERQIERKRKCGKEKTSRQMTI